MIHILFILNQLGHCSSQSLCVSSQTQVLLLWRYQPALSFALKCALIQEGFRRFVQACVGADVGSWMVKDHK